MNFGKNQGGNLKIFHCGNHINMPKWNPFPIFGMNISYLLFSNFDLPIIYIEFYEIAADVTW